MHEDDHTQKLAADNEHAGRTHGRTDPDQPAPPFSVQGEGSWANLLLFLEVSPDALVLVEASGRIAAVNSQAAALFGYTRAELVGQMLELLLPERLHAAHQLHRERYATSPHARPMGAGLALFGRRHDGSEFPVDISLSPLLFAGALYVLAAIRDITERKLLQEREHAARILAEARLALLQLILDELPTGVTLVQGEDVRLVLANQAAATLWGAEWLPGQPMTDFLTTHRLRLFDTHGRTLPPAALATVRALHEGQAMRQYQEVIQQADGTRLPVLVNAVPLSQPLLSGLTEGEEPDPTTSPEPAVLVVHQDVAALKEAERLKDQFLGLVAHELRNPLAALKGFATMLLRYAQGDKGTPLAPWQQEALSEIDLATDRLDRLTEDLLDVVRLQAGRLVLHREALDLVTITRRVLAHMGQQSSPHQLTLSTSLTQLVAQADGGRIEQVLANLLSNAIKYSPDGGPVEVSVQVAAGGQEALVSIRDHGIGIPQAEQAQLFGRFARASNGEALGISGTGLGLYLCRELVAQHGGDLWFESTEGVGSTFFLRLPLLQNPSSRDGAERAPAAKKKRKPTL